MTGRLKPKNEMYSSGGSLNTRWAMDDVLTEYDSLLSKNIAEAKAWRTAGLLSVGMLVVMCLAFMYLGIKPKREFVVIGVNDIGQVKYYGNVEGKSFESFTDVDKVLKNIIYEFVTKRFTVSGDSDVMYSNFQSCLYYLDANRRQALIDEINTEDPFSQVGRYKSNVEMDTIIPLTKSSFQAEWVTTVSEINGVNAYKTRYRGIFSFTQISVEQYSQLTDKEYLNNASGFYITDYNIQEVKTF